MLDASQTALGGSPPRPIGGPAGQRTVRRRGLKPGPYPAIASKAFLGVARMRVSQWDYRLRHLEATQMRMLRMVVEANAASSYGRQHGMGEVRTFEDWTRQVPVADYDSYVPYFSRMMKGESDVLVRGKVKYFGNSAGSSNQGRQKFLPLTERQLRITARAAADMSYRYVAAKNDDSFVSGYTVGIYPPPIMKPTEAVIVSNNPALMSMYVPPLARPVYTPRGATKMEENLDRKMELIARDQFDWDVISVGGTTCWFSLFFDKLLAEANRRGLRARTVSDVWPNMRVLFGGGVAAGPYLPVIRARVGNPDVTLVDTYNATEGGLFACTDHSGEPGMLMLPDRGVFFEFVPLEEADSDNPTRIPLWGVQKDRNYVIHVSTVSGLSSYRLGDIVRFRSTDPLRIEFAGRLAGCLSTTQELTTHVEVQQAVDAALKRYPGAPRDYACAADVGIGETSKAQYALYVEFEHEPSGFDAGGFARAFDEELIRINRVYREHREKEVAILPARVVGMPRGTANRFMDQAGFTSVQSKFPRILNDAQKDLLRTVLDQHHTTRRS